MTVPLTFGSLFAGIGGLDLGLERAGMRCVWQVEKDEYCRRVLAKHWPDVTRYEDVRDVGRDQLAPVDVICGGFPCQDISSSGAKVGIHGARSGLWSEYARIIGELRPAHVLVENVADLLTRGMGTVLGDLAAIGYDAEWESLPAAAFGLPQRRWRVFLVAYAGRRRRDRRTERDGAGPFSLGRLDGDGLALAEHRARHEAAALVRGMDAGVPGRVDRNRALGNSVAPAVAEFVGRLIVEHAA